MKKTKSLLDLFVRHRTYKILDRAAEKNRYYRTTLKEQDRAYDELQKAGLNKEQKRIVDKALSALNANGTAYGKVAYRLGLHDGIRLMLEVNSCISEKAYTDYADILPDWFMLQKNRLPRPQIERTGQPVFLCLF